jgi:hypothetical protein
MNTFNDEENKFFRSLTTAQKIQDYLDTIPFNHENNGETCRSAKEVFKNKTAHCLEGAFLAAYILTLQGKKPLILSLKVIEKDYDHVITLYKENGYFGAISKTNHAVLGFRDPIYRTIRELALSYFHEYFLTKNGEKTLRGYSRPINLNRFRAKWKYSEEDLFDIAITISEAYYHHIIPKGNEAFIRKATILERTSASISQDGQ